MRRYDLHMHSNISPDSINKPDTILSVAKRIGLNGVAITDHDSIKGALATKRLNKNRDFEVIVGQEMKTDYGDLIALYVNERIKARSMWDVIDEVKSQGGLIVIPHPFRIFEGFRYPIANLKGKVDAVEAFNSRYILSNRIAARTPMPMAKVGSSDAHIPFEIGKGYTLFEGDLRTAIKKSKTRFGGDSSLALISQAASMACQYVLNPLGLK